MLLEIARNGSERQRTICSFWWPRNGSKRFRTVRNYTKQCPPNWSSLGWYVMNNFCTAPNGSGLFLTPCQKRFGTVLNGPFKQLQAVRNGSEQFPKYPPLGGPLGLETIRNGSERFLEHAPCQRHQWPSGIKYITTSHSVRNLSINGPSMVPYGPYAGSTLQEMSDKCSQLNNSGHDQFSSAAAKTSWQLGLETSSRTLALLVNSVASKPPAASWRPAQQPASRHGHTGPAAPRAPQTMAATTPRSLSPRSPQLQGWTYSQGKFA